MSRQFSPGTPMDKPTLEEEPETSEPSPEPCQQDKAPDIVEVSTAKESNGDTGHRPQTCKERLRRIIHHHRFEVSIAVLVVLNVMVMFAQLEHKGYLMCLDLGLENNSNKWISATEVFDAIEHLFNALFVLELLLRLYVDGLAVFHHAANIFDAMVVVISCLDCYVLQLALGNEDGANLSFARVARLFKLVKMSRAFRAAALFSELRILILTIIGSMMALTWSVLLLAFVCLCCGLFMAQVVAAVIEDTSQNLDLRVWVYQHYGTGFRAAYTMFEATMSGAWPNYARRLIEEVSIGFAAFWVVYVIFVVFAVIRVITALFLKNTLKVSEGDSEMMVMEKMKDKEKYVKKSITKIEKPTVCISYAIWQLGFAFGKAQYLVFPARHCELTTCNAYKGKR